MKKTADSSKPFDEAPPETADGSGPAKPELDLPRTIKLRGRAAQAVERIARKRAEEAEQAAKSDRQLSLDLWSEPMRGIPNEYVRCALFRVGNPRRTKGAANVRPTLTNAELPLRYGPAGRILYTGPVLFQGDETVFLQLLHLARGQDLDAPIEIEPYGLAAELSASDRRPSASDVAVAAEAIKRLEDAKLVIEAKRLEESGLRAGRVSFRLVRKAVMETLDGKAKRWQIWLEPETVKLFGGGWFSRVEWQQRLLLPTGLATSLHSLFASHREPWPIDLDTIHAIAGASTTIKADPAATPSAKRAAAVARAEFRRLVRTACDHLKDVGFLAGWTLADDTLSVVRA